ncbi:MAG: anthranilate phosphoribosyltransferase [Chloroflexota bacterium]
MIKEAISLLVAGKDLSLAESARTMEEIMAGEATPAQLGAFLTALRLKGETADEIAGLASVMRAKAVPVSVSGPVVDTCGTGGDGASTFNISTAAAFVAAGAGLKVAKHGNRAATSQCGSADVLEALGVNIMLDAAGVARCIEQVGIGFMFATSFHPAMKYAAAPRREIGIRTVFNILGPLTNPAGAKSQVIGVASDSLTLKLAEVLERLGSRHVLVVHGGDGLDEITLTRETQVCELKNGKIESYSVSPEDFGLKRVSLDTLKGGTSQENAGILREVLSGASGARREVVLLNSAAALLAGDRVSTLKEGMALSAEVIDHGQAISKLDGLIKLSQSLK